MSNVKVGLVQMSCTADKDANLAKAIAKVREAAAKGAQIVCLQELFTSLYFCDVEDYENFKLAESIPGVSTDALSAVAAELNVVIIASLFEKRTQGINHNTTAVLDADGSYLGKYRKMHIPDDPAFYEKFYFTPGDLGYKIFKTNIRQVLFSITSHLEERLIGVDNCVAIISKKSILRFFENFPEVVCTLQHDV